MNKIPRVMGFKQYISCLVDDQHLENITDLGNEVLNLLLVGKVQSSFWKPTFLLQLILEPCLIFP